MIKEKDYTFTVEVHVAIKDEPHAKRRYSIKIYQHPLEKKPEPVQVKLSNMRDERALKVGRVLLEAIYSRVAKTDSKFWE